MTVLTLQPAEATALDTYIESGAPTTNYGTSGNIATGENNAGASGLRSLLKFDLSSIPAGSVIDSAVLSLTISVDLSSNARTFRVFRQKRAWTESGATWNKYDGTTDWQTAGGFGADDCEQTDIGSAAYTATESIGTVKTYTLTASAVQAMITGGSWTDNGFLVKADTEVDDLWAHYSSGDGTSSNRPKLVVTYHQALTVTLTGAIASISGAISKAATKSFAGSISSVSGALTKATTKSFTGAVSSITGSLSSVFTAIPGLLVRLFTSPKITIEADTTPSVSVEADTVPTGRIELDE